MRTNRIKARAKVIISIAAPPALGVGCALLLASLAALSSLLDGARNIFSSPGSVKEFVGGFGAFSLLSLLLVQAAQVVAGPVLAAPVIVAGSALFGFLKGIALSMTGVVAGSAGAFLLGRRFGHPLLRLLHSEETLARHHAIPTGAPLRTVGDGSLCSGEGISKLSWQRRRFPRTM